MCIRYIRPISCGQKAGGYSRLPFVRPMHDPPYAQADSSLPLPDPPLPDPAERSFSGMDSPLRKEPQPCGVANDSHACYSSAEGWCSR